VARRTYEEDHDESRHIERSVEAESTRWRHCCEHAWPSEGEHGSPEETGRHSPRHPNLPVRQREYLSRVSERHWTLTRAVEGRKQEDKESNAAEMGGALLWNVETEPSGEEGPRHLREGEKEQCSATEGVDRPDGWEGEDEVDQTEAETGQQGSQVRGASLREDTGRVESDDVNAAHLYNR